MDRSGVTKPRVHVCHSKELLAEEVGDLVVRLASHAIGERGSFVVAFSGGSLPALVAPRLLELRDAIQWSKWEVFFADERYVALDDKESNYQACHQELLRHVPIPREHIHTIDASLPLDECARAYQVLYPYIQLGLGGCANKQASDDYLVLGCGAPAGQARRGHTAKGG